MRTVVGFQIALFLVLLAVIPSRKHLLYHDSFIKYHFIKDADGICLAMLYQMVKVDLYHHSSCACCEMQI